MFLEESSSLWVLLQTSPLFVSHLVYLQVYLQA
jgi:hypothetical protein